MILNFLYVYVRVVGGELVVGARFEVDCAEAPTEFYEFSLLEHLVKFVFGTATSLVSGSPASATGLASRSFEK